VNNDEGFGYNRLSEKKRVLGLEDLNKFRLSEKKRVLGLEGLKKKQSEKERFLGSRNKKRIRILGMRILFYKGEITLTSLEISLNNTNTPSIYRVDINLPSNLLKYIKTSLIKLAQLILPKNINTVSFR
jgi:hypothetical protein